MTNLLQEKKEKRANPGNERWLFLHPVAWSSVWTVATRSIEWKVIHRLTFWSSSVWTWI
jgi:hypothetical protein